MLRYIHQQAAFFEQIEMENGLELFARVLRRARNTVLHYDNGRRNVLLLQLLDFGGQALNVRVVLLLVLRSKPDHTPTDTLNSMRTLTSSSESSWFALSRVWMVDPTR